MKSSELFQRAQRVIPGGVNSPVRAFRSVGGDPVYMASGSGSRMTTADGHVLVDFCSSWGPLLFGHARREIVEAVCKAAAEGTSFGTNTPREVEFAEQLCRMIPTMEMVRLVSSGTEAVMSAVRLARGFMGRNKIIKFDGCYHGHSDSVLVSAGSGLLTGGTLTSPGISRHVASDTFVVPYNDLDAVNALIREKGQEIAAIIVEPVAANMGLVMPEPGYLAKLRHYADRCGALLIFDEVINGFRFNLSSYAKIAGVKPDLMTLGKVIGGGLPLAAVGGAAVFMDELAPRGKIYQAGTLSGNPLAVAAGLKTIEILERDDPYPRLEQLGQRVAEIINTAAASKGLPFRCAQYGGVFTVFFTGQPVKNLEDAKRCDTKAYAQHFHSLLNRGYYLPPSQFEVGFISTAHSAEEVTAFAQAVVG